MNKIEQLYLQYNLKPNVMPQSLSQVYLHIVFSTKHHNRYIHENIRPDLQAYIVGILSELNSYVIEIYANPDHVHILCNLPRTISIAQLVNKVKSNSSRWMKYRDETFFKWQDGYGVFSVSQNDLENVKKYIMNQTNHHNTISFKEEMRRLFDDYYLEYDEKYVWD